MELSRPDNRKILIFSEFADTANYLYEKLLAKKYKVFRYTAKQGSKKENRKIIKQEFDASSEKLTNNLQSYGKSLRYNGIGRFHLYELLLIYYHQFYNKLRHF